MKFEIEITEDEIRDALLRKIRVAIADQTKQWGVEDYIVKRVRELWQGTADKLVEEELSKSADIKAKITASIERKLTSQINKLMKVGK